MHWRAKKKGFFCFSAFHIGVPEKFFLGVRGGLNDDQGVSKNQGLVTIQTRYAYGALINFLSKELSLIAHFWILVPTGGRIRTNPFKEGEFPKFPENTRISTDCRETNFRAMIMIRGAKVICFLCRIRFQAQYLHTHTSPCVKSLKR